MRRTLHLAIGLLLSAAWLASPVFAQRLEPLRPDLGLLAADKGAQVFNRTLTTLKEGARSVARLDARPGDGGAVLEGARLGEGIIEVDLRGKDVAQQSFLGIAFHFVDWTQYDAVYFRPFNFRAAGPEQRSHAVQYISHPVNTWQKLRAERPGQFEKAIDPPPDPTGWFHARIVIAHSKVEVYVNGAATPSLVVDDLGEAKSGGVALWAGNGSDGAYANLVITPTAPPGPPPASRQSVFDAARTGNVARLRALVEADPGVVNARMLMGATPLHLAAASSQRAAVEFLLSKGADLNAVARHAGTPLDMAYESGRRDSVEWLQAKGARFTPLRFDISTLTPSVRRVAFPWGMMNNVLVFSRPDGAVIVDSGFSTRAIDELRKVILGFSPAGTRFIVNSHVHGDHVAGNGLVPGSDAVITAAALAAGPPQRLSITRNAGPLKGRSGRTLPAGYTWRTGGTDVTLIPRPGLHSDSDLIVYFPSESVVAMGDLLLSESMPAVTDLPGYLAFLDDVLDVFPENTTFVSGHGRDLDAAGVRAYRDDLKAMIAVVQAGLASGRSADQLVKDDALKAYKAKYSLLSFLDPDTLIPRVSPPPRAAGSAPGVEQVVRALYQSVSFEAGRKVDWDQVRPMFVPEAVIVLRTSRTAMSVFDREGFVRDFVRFIADAKLEDRAFEEKILAISTSETGDVARATVHYAARIPSEGRPAQEGIDLFQLLKKDGAWKIVSIVNEIVRPGVAVPAEVRR